MANQNEFSNGAEPPIEQKLNLSEDLYFFRPNRFTRNPLVTKWRNFTSKLRGLYYKKISYEAESLLLILLYLPTLGNYILMYCLPLIDFSYREIGILVVSGILLLLHAGFSGANVTNRRHSEMRAMFIFLSGRGAGKTLISAFQSKYESWTLKILDNACIILGLIAAFTVIETRKPYLNELGISVQYDNTAPMVNSDVVYVNLFAAGTTLSCDDCFSFRSAEHYLVPVTTNLVSTAGLFSIDLLSVDKQDVISIKSTCTKSKISSLKGVNGGDFIMHTSKLNSLTSPAKGIEMQIEIGASKNDPNPFSIICDIVAMEFSGMVQTKYNLNARGVPTRLNIDSIVAVNSTTCTTIGNNCLDPSSRTGRALELFSGIFDSNFDAAMNFKMVSGLDFFPSASESHSDAYYSDRISSGISSLIVSHSMLNGNTLVQSPIKTYSHSNFQCNTYILIVGFCTGVLSMLLQLIIIFIDLKRLHKYSNQFNFRKLALRMSPGIYNMDATSEFFKECDILSTGALNEKWDRYKIKVINSDGRIKLKVK